jgi:hypothetical protein
MHLLKSTPKNTIEYNGSTAMIGTAGLAAVLRNLPASKTLVIRNTMCACAREPGHYRETDTSLSPSYHGQRQGRGVGHSLSRHGRELGRAKLCYYANVNLRGIPRVFRRYSITASITQATEF